MSLEFQQIGKYTTRVIGPKEQVEDLRKKLQDLGIYINDNLYLELRVVPEEINNLKKKYNITKTQKGIEIHVPTDSTAQINELFNNNKDIELHFPEKTAMYNFTRDGETISVFPPDDYPMPESTLITNSLKLLNLYNSK